MHCVREYACSEYNEEYEEIIDEIITTAQNDRSATFQKSRIYSTQNAVKFIDENLRMSQFKNINKQELFSLCDELVDLLSKMDRFYNWMLVKNDVTFIKYSQGGFFKRHQDYTTITSNVMEEFTLIICVDANCVGGETVLYFNDYFQYASLATTTPKHALLFRKDIKHEGLMIHEGYKHILMMNLYGFRKNDNYKQQNVVINFRNHPSNPIVIPLNNILELPDTKLAKTIIQSMDEKKSLLLYEENETEYKVWKSAFYKIYNRSYIHIDMFRKYETEIISYGFRYKNILLDFTENAMWKCKFCGLNNYPNIIECIACFKETENEEENDEEEVENRNRMNLSAEGITLCDNISQQIFMLDAIKKERLQYIPFKIMLAEGAARPMYQEEYKLEMQTQWVSFGELDHIYCYQDLGSTHPEQCHFDLRRRPKGKNLSLRDLVRSMCITNDNTYPGDRNKYTVDDDPKYVYEHNRSDYEEYDDYSSPSEEEEGKQGK